MRDQMPLLESEDWRVLIVMDAARSDTAFEVCHGDVRIERVRSPATQTLDWVKAVGPLFAGLGKTAWLSANPVVDYGIEQCAVAGIVSDVVPMWRDLWGWHTPLGIPTVHPHVFAAQALAWIQQCTAHVERIVVHFMSPHHPFIGTPPFDTTRWGRDDGGHVGTDGLFANLLERRANADFSEEHDAFVAGYVANYAQTWDAVSWLHDHLHPLRCLITADHGERLGENGIYGHLHGTPSLRVVPMIWREPRTQAQTITDKLVALGYM